PLAAGMTARSAAVMRWCTRLDAPWLAPGAVALVCLPRPWFGVLVCGATWFVARRRPAPRARARSAWAIAGVSLLAHLPGPPATPTLDAFHDGQILSAVWEFEQGRTLFAEVFPLRNYEFFYTWLTRRLLEPSIANYFMTQRATEFLPVAAI